MTGKENSDLLYRENLCTRVSFTETLCWTLWEGHKIWKIIQPVVSWQNICFFPSSFKTSGIFFQIFAAFSEKLDLQNFTLGFNHCFVHISLDNNILHQSLLPTSSISNLFKLIFDRIQFLKIIRNILTNFLDNKILNEKGDKY